MNDRETLVREVAQQFLIDGKLTAVQEVKIGHIHDTYLSIWQSSNSTSSFIHQRLNTSVFQDIDKMMDTVLRVTEHIDSAINREATDDTVCKVVRSCEGKSFYWDDSGAPWRTYTCIENTKSYQVCPSEEVAYRAAACCGRFQRYVADCDADSFPEIIPGFHDADYRYQKFEEALAKDSSGRAKGVAKEINFVQSRRSEVSRIYALFKSGEIPRWLTHNDLKLNNVLFDKDSDKAVSLVDLDTYMPGSPLLDFGDLVRVASTTAREDEPDLKKVTFNLDYFNSLARGYWQEIKPLVVTEEWELASLAPITMTLIIGLRFLTDYLNGDTYFKISYPEHNLARARVQLALVEEMEKAQSAMDRELQRIRNS